MVSLIQIQVIEIQPMTKQTVILIVQSVMLRPAH